MMRYRQIMELKMCMMMMREGMCFRVGPLRG